MVVKMMLWLLKSQTTKKLEEKILSKCDFMIIIKSFCILYNKKVVKFESFNFFNFYSF